MMCGLTASGKSTISEILTKRLNASLIRICDINRSLNIHVNRWDTCNSNLARAISTERDAAYNLISKQVRNWAVSGSRFIVLDAAYAERAKRKDVYEFCVEFAVKLTIVVCKCSDGAEVAQRIALRLNDNTDPTKEASDPKVLDYMKSIWIEPTITESGAIRRILYIDTSKQDTQPQIEELIQDLVAT